jgi:threonine/homoserine/homoserine lactone efflux protein
MGTTMVSLSVYVTYVVACCALVIVPGPSVSVIIANSLRRGTRAGLANVLGTQIGLAFMVIILAVGLDSVVTTLGFLFDWIKMAGALYLIWLGWKLWRSGGTTFSAAEPSTQPSDQQPMWGFVWQGLVVILSNPKALIFFGAFIPQFLDPSGNTLSQTLVFGFTFMVVATVLDSGYALLAGSIGRLLSQSRLTLLERLSGSLLIGGGIWLALTRRS